MPVKQELHLMLWCKPQLVAPREALCHTSEDIIFTETDVSWVHHPHKDTLVIITKIVKSLIHRVLIESGSAINILYWNAYQKIGLNESTSARLPHLFMG